MSPIQLLAHSDDWVTGRVHRWRPPRWVQVWMVASTRLGDGWAWLVMIVVAPARGDGRAAHTLAETLVKQLAAGPDFSLSFLRDEFADLDAWKNRSPSGLPATAKK